MVAVVVVVVEVEISVGVRQEEQPQTICLIKYAPLSTDTVVVTDVVTAGIVLVSEAVATFVTVGAVMVVVPVEGVSADDTGPWHLSAYA